MSIAAFMMSHPILVFSVGFIRKFEFAIVLNLIIVDWTLSNFFLANHELLSTSVTISLSCLDQDYFQAGIPVNRG